MSELNLKQVRNALECWASGNPCEGSCCPLFEISPDTCDRWIGRNALSLIKELTEENERLRAERDLRDIVIKDLTERNKELQTANEDLGQYCQELERELLEGDA